LTCVGSIGCRDLCGQKIPLYKNYPDGNPGFFSEFTGDILLDAKTVLSTSVVQKVISSLPLTRPQSIIIRVRMVNRDKVIVFIMFVSLLI